MAFDPNEPRDTHGRWTAYGGGLTHTAPGMPSVSVASPANAERAKAIAEQAAVVARKLDFDPHDITVSDESKTFELNGKTMFYAGAAHLPPPQGDGTVRVKGTITLYTPHISSDTEIPGLTAHEIMHQKFQALINDYRDEYDRMQKDPDYESSRNAGGGRADTFMRQDGMLKAPYDARYPAYQAYTKALMPDASDFAKTDGVSNYSRDWWDAWHGKTVNTAQAMHETLAEIARKRLSVQRDKEAHAANVAYIKDKGGTWTPEMEKDWRKNFAANSNNAISHIVRKPDGMLTLRKGIDPAWNAVYKAAEDNWKRRNK